MQCQLRSSEEAKKTTCSFQAYGYGLGSPKSEGAVDQTIQCATHSIKRDLLQGHNDKWRTATKLNLPEPLRTQTGATWHGLVEL
ncbi:hypothetical protein PCANC_28103 [Puccinia coronata f. sp. avenae]|uniref:Uncharacterized protein n=1 Tax=Puccinia coronata f. sp. avenae TaxID=200324 RepID=A0A2N5TNA9_9BASI|nr:hypothetical protein PCANC_28103 [Puccinia coronata f. sp. avenae]